MAGTTTNNSYIGIGVTLTGDDTLINALNGTIANSSGPAVLGLASALPDTVVNYGVIRGGDTGSSAIGINLQSGGVITNLTAASVSGLYGIDIGGGGGTLTNQGVVTAGLTGVQLRAGGLIDNAGTIGVTTGDKSIDHPAVRFAAGFTNRLIVRPGAVFDGVVDGGNTAGSGYASTLELASGSAAGTLAGIGSQYLNFQSVTIVSGAAWTLAGGNSMSAGTALTNAGTLTNAGVLDVRAGVLGLAFLAGGAQLINGQSGTFAGGVYGDSLGAARTVVNAGLFTVSSGTGINLQGAGRVSNASTGQILNTGDNPAIDVSGAATIDNEGTIRSDKPGASGVLLRGGGTVSNAVNATISAGFYAVGIGNLSGTVSNAGAIRSDALIGVALNAGGHVDNQAGGTITAHYEAVKFGYVFGTLTNAGSLSSDTGRAVQFGAGGNLTSGTTGRIVGQGVGVVVDGGLGTIANAGSIGAVYGAGVVMTAGGSFSNEASGRVEARTGIVVSGGAGTVTNSGVIAGTYDFAISFDTGHTHRLIALPGATFNGLVDGGNAPGSGFVSTLELAAGGSTGTLTGLGSHYIGFAQFAIDTGASWVLGGSNALATEMTLSNAGTLTLVDASLTGAGALINNGRVVLDPSTLSVGALSGTGTVAIEAGSTLSVIGTVAAGETVDFNGVAGLMELGTPQSFAGLISGFDTDDAIELSGVTVTTANVLPGNTLELALTAGGTIGLRFDPTEDLSGIVFQATEVGGNAVITQQVVPCFAAGTLILTECGEVPVESLAIGDRVITWSGASVPIVWIGQRRIALRAHPQPQNVAPVCVRAHAFGADLPRRDLFLSPDHGLYVDGALIPVKYLVNGSSVVPAAAEAVTYFHVELARHDVLLAEGLPAESYLDTGDRANFANYGDVVRLHADFSGGGRETTGIVEAYGYAPLVVTGPRLAAARRLLASASADLGDQHDLAFRAQAH